MELKKILQFDGTEECAEEISKELDMYQDSWDVIEQGMLLKNITGSLVAVKGDWITKTEKGIWDIITPYTFNHRYGD